jgi:hypothetical protein
MGQIPPPGFETFLTAGAIAGSILAALAHFVPMRRALRVTPAVTLRDS